jgi:N6-L-threonylcarbamoyladenine synthase
VLGRTRDDAAGECFDKIAKMLHLGYPGGPIVDRLAQHGDAAAIHFPRAMLDKETFDFSFSGVKTAVRTHVLQMMDAQGERFFHDDTFWPLPTSSSGTTGTTISWPVSTGGRRYVSDHTAGGGTDGGMRYCRGGVACNSGLRSAMHRAIEGVCAGIFPPQFCVRTMAMIACAAAHPSHGPRVLSCPEF